MKREGNHRRLSSCDGGRAARISRLSWDDDPKPVNKACVWIPDVGGWDGVWWCLSGSYGSKGTKSGPYNVGAVALQKAGVEWEGCGFIFHCMCSNSHQSSQECGARQHTSNKPLFVLLYKTYIIAETHNICLDICKDI